jgi:hypothetical protein
MYERLVLILKRQETKLLKIAHAIRATRIKIEEYIKRSRTNQIYALAMSSGFLHLQQ